MLSWLRSPILRKVPEVTAIFWVIKLLTTAMGESTSDYLVNSYNPYIVVMLGFVAFAVAVTLQFMTPKYIPWAYWLAVLMVAVFGTMAADVIHVALGVTYIASTVVFTAVLATVFLTWHHVEGTLSIHSITTRRREAFYWATVSATFALGTAAGDMAAYSAHLGFFAAGIVFAAMFAAPVIGYRIFRWNEVLCFWLAYILTRPLGASFADWTGKAQSAGGLGWGDGPVATFLLTAIVILVTYLTFARSGASKRA